MDSRGRRRFWRLGILLTILIAVVAARIAFRPQVKRVVAPIVQRIRGQATVAERVRQYGAAARSRLLPHFDRAGVAYPPRHVVLAYFKSSNVLHVYAAGTTNTLQFIREYPVLRSSGGPGPKLREGDRQVPEGLYDIEYLNPNSAYHLSLAIGYPNGYDRRQARADGRRNLGGDIMIHGSDVSIGCLAMGDQAAEDLFVLAAETGIARMRVILSPVDFRSEELPDGLSLPAWTRELYSRIAAELGKLPMPPRLTT